MTNRIRATLGVAVAGVLVSAAVAWAAARHYGGTVQPGGTVKVTTGFSHGHRVVMRFSVSGVPIHCVGPVGSVPPVSFDTADGKTGGGSFPTISISYRRFHIRDSGSSMTLSTVVNGQFNAKFSRVTGTVRFYGPNYPDAGCDTGKAAWTAQ